MPKMIDMYNYANGIFAVLHEPMRAVMSAYGNAEKWFAAIKEVTWHNWGMLYLTDLIHRLEHFQPEKVDQFKGILAQIGLPVEYPATPELGERFDDIDRVFEICISIVDSIDNALVGFISTCDANKFSAVARGAEQLLMDNSSTRTKLLEAWNMWGNTDSIPTFDGWVKKLPKQSDFNPF